MAIYRNIPGSLSLSGLVAALAGQADAIRTHERGSTEPTVKVVGGLWIDTTSGKDVWKQWNVGATWDTLFTLASGEMDVGGRVVKNVGAPSGNGHALRYQDGVLRSGLTADLPAGGYKITGLADPTSAQDAATKAYADAAMACGIGVIADVTGTQRGLTVSGLGFAPRVIQIQLDAYGDATAERSQPTMAAGYAVGSSPTVDLFITFPDSTSGNPIVTKRVAGTIRRDSTGFSLTYTVPLKTDNSKPTAGRCMWTAWR